MQGQQQKETKSSPAAARGALPKAPSERPKTSRLISAIAAFSKDLWHAGATICSAAKAFVFNLNRFSSVSVLLTLSAMLAIWFGHPTANQLPNVLRGIAAILGVSAGFMSNTNLSNQPRTPAQIKEDKKVALLLTCLGAFLVLCSLSI